MNETNLQSSFSPPKMLTWKDYLLFFVYVQVVAIVCGIILGVIDGYTHVTHLSHPEISETHLASGFISSIIVFFSSIIIGSVVYFRQKIRKINKMLPLKDILKLTLMFVIWHFIEVIGILMFGKLSFSEIFSVQSLILLIAICLLLGLAAFILLFLIQHLVAPMNLRKDS
jgi:hypothetical protein